MRRAGVVDDVGAALSVDPDVEAALVSDRMARVESRLGELEAQARESNAHLSRLVQLAEADDARKEAALLAELKRKEASQEAEAKRVDAELAERAERGRWWRTTGLPPILTGVGTLLAAAATALGTWAAGMWGGDR